MKIFHALGSIHQRARWLTFSPACLYMYALTAGHYSTLRPANTIDHLRGFPSDSRYVRSRATARAPDRLNGLTLVAQKKRKKKKKKHEWTTRRDSAQFWHDSACSLSFCRVIIEEKPTERNERTNVPCCARKVIRWLIDQLHHAPWARLQGNGPLFINEKKKRIHLGLRNDSRLLALNKRKPVGREIEIGEAKKDYKMRIGERCLWANYFYGNKSLDGGEEKRSKSVKVLVRSVLFSFFFSYLSSTSSVR